MESSLLDRLRQLENLPYDDWTHKIEMQGTLCIWKIFKGIQKTPPPKPHGTITGFSRDARFRMLSAFNRLDFDNIPKALFLTLTYPDQVIVKSKDQFNQNLSTFWRRLETYLGRHQAAFWRLEHIDRKTGLYVGQMWPHIHLLIPGLNWLKKATIREMWGKSIGYKKVIVWPVACTGQKGAAWYIAKYCGKPPDCSLVISLNLNKCSTGKQWGILRRKLLPNAQKYTIRIPQGMAAMEVLSMVHAARPSTGANQDGSFTILGDLTPIIRGFLLKLVDTGEAALV